MCSAGSIRPPSTKITKTIASTGRWQSNPMSSSREKKKGKKYWTEEASHGADILPAVLNVADLAFRRLWKFDSHHRSSQLYVRLFLFSPYNLCPSLSLAKIKKKKEEEENNKRAARELSVDTGFLPIRSLPCYVALPLTRKRTWLLERRVSVCSHPSSNSQAAQ